MPTRTDCGGANHRHGPCFGHYMVNCLSVAVKRSGGLCTAGWEALRAALIGERGALDFWVAMGPASHEL